MFDHLESLNPEQRAAAAARLNSVCSAGAGAGKTLVLSRRYLGLLLGGEGREAIPPEGILTLTFTRKAAGEMYERIYQTLIRNRRHDPRLAKAVEDFDRARIMTLDSFCRGIAVSGCARYGIPPSFRMDEEELGPLVRAEIRRFLGEKSADPVFHAYCRTFSLSGIWEQVLEPIGTQLALPVPMIPSLTEAVGEDLEAVGKMAESFARELMLHARDVWAYIEEGIEARPAPLTEKQEQAVQAIRELAEWEGEGEVPQIPNKPSKRSFPGLDEGFDNAWDGMKAARGSYQDCKGFLADPDAAMHLAGLLEEFRQKVIAAKRRRAVLSFTDTLALAIQILIDDPGLADYYRESIKAIMIDEFQDNNAVQKNLLYLLSAAPGYREARVPAAEEIRQDVLFFVGDQKQSIYRFRGADVRVFKDLSTELESRELRLSTNYRSNPRLIKYFNGLFHRVFAAYPGQSQESLDYEAEFEPISSRDPLAGEPEPIIELWFQPYKSPKTASGEGAEGSREAGAGGQGGKGGQDAGDAVGAAVAGEVEDAVGADEAEGAEGAGRAEGAEERGLDRPDAEFRELALRIRRMLDSGSLVWDRGAKMARPLRENDIGILLRSGGNQMRLERMLRLYGISYQVRNDRSLFLDAIAADVAAVLALCLYPTDKEAWITLARGPLLNLGNQGLVALSQVDSPERELPDFNEETDRERFENFLMLLHDARDLLRQADPAKVADLVWDRGGYWAFALESRNAQGFYDQFENLRAFLAGFRGGPASEAVRALRENIGHFEKVEIEGVLQARRDGVSIMTVHASKGLEFPVVILADIGTGQRQIGGKRAAAWISTGRDGLPRFYLNPALDYGGGDRGANPLVSMEIDKAKFAEWAELKRLFYVACTRAENHLLVYGSFGNKTANSFRAALDRKTQELNPNKLDQCFLSLFVSAYIDDFPQDLIEAGASDAEILAAIDRFPDGARIHQIKGPGMTEWQQEKRSLSQRKSAEHWVLPDKPIEYEVHPLYRFPSDHHRPLEEDYRPLEEDYRPLGGEDSSLGGEHRPEEDKQEGSASVGQEQEQAVGRAPGLDLGQGQAERQSQTQEVSPTGPDPRLLGSLAHWVLQTLLEDAQDVKNLFGAPPELPPPGFWGKLPAFLTAGMGKEAESYQLQAWALGQGFFKSDIAAKLGAKLREDPGSSLKSELAFLRWEEDRWLRGTIDLLASFPGTAERWVIDYKSDYVEDPAFYAPQIRDYLRAVRDMVLEHPGLKIWKPRAFLVYLRSGKAVEVFESD